VRKVVPDLLGRPASVSVRNQLAAILDGGLTRTQLLDVILSSPQWRYVFISRLVIRLVNRPVTNEEAAVLLGVMADGWTPEMIHALALASDEFYRVHGGSPERFVDHLYRVVLGRPPTAAEADIWRRAMPVGWSRLAVAWYVLTSEEGRRAQVNSVYQRYLRRDAAPGTPYGNRLEHVIAAAVASPVYSS
jgi:hypothetical protein